jgi:hypothetical protein
MDHHFPSYRSAAIYVDEILRGENPANLPDQQPVKFDLIINLKTAKALDLTIPSGLITEANEVIEWVGRCPLMAQSGHYTLVAECLLSGVKRT